MLHQLDVQSLIDIGFVIFVTIACYISLNRSSNVDQDRSKRWREELRELEGVLRSLIEEAGAASNSLDRRLLTRKRELENLLGRIEDSTGEASIPSSVEREDPEEVVAPPQATPKPSVASSRRNVRGNPELSDLPNDSWNVPESRTSRPRERTGELPSRLEELLDSQDDTLKLSRAAREAVGEDDISLTGRIWESKKPTSDLEVEVTPDIVQETFEQTSIIDPVTYKIARRLLNSGKELHVVARKLELPVSEVRLLDKLMRQEKKTGVLPEHEASRSEIEVERTAESKAKVIQTGVSEFENLAPPKVQTTGSDIEMDIEREVALL